MKIERMQDFIITNGVAPDGTPLFFLYLQSTYDNPGFCEPLAGSPDKDKLIGAIQHMWEEPTRFRKEIGT